MQNHKKRTIIGEMCVNREATVKAIFSKGLQRQRKLTLVINKAVKETGLSTSGISNNDKFK